MFSAWSRFVLFVVIVCTAAVTAQTVPQLVRLSPLDNAGYNDIVVSRDGTIHAFWQGKPKSQQGWTVFYSASRDGRRWTSPLDLGAQDGRVSGVRAAADAAGRVYVLWKSQPTGNSSDPEINQATLVGSDWGTLRFRVLENGRWSGVQDLVRPGTVFGWFVAADRDGGVHVIWSETADTYQGGMMLLSSAGTIRHARLAGTQAQTTTITQNRGAGFHGLHGAIAADGRPRFLALANDKLFLWNGERLVTVADWNSSWQHPPRLLLDATGRPHVLLLAGKSLTELTPDGQRRPVFDGPVEHFEVSQDGSGRSVVLVGTKPGNLVELAMTSLVNGTWTRPVAITANERSGRESGFMDANGTTINSVSAWNARYASAAFDQQGGVSVLITNNRVATSADERRSAVGNYGIASALSAPQVFFARVGGAALPPATASPTVVSDSPQPSPRRADDPRRMPEPAAPARSSRQGLPTGTYTCEEISQYAGRIPTGRTVAIVDDHQYRVSDLGGGEYAFTSSPRSLRWTSGPFAARGVTVTFGEEAGKYVLRFNAASGATICSLPR